MSEKEMEKKETVEIETVTKGKVIIKKDAFRNMITHVLRYGSEELEESEEVMGICMGKNASNGDILVQKALPITHGDRVEVGLSDEIHDDLKKLSVKYKENDLFIVGWYHSHPGWGLFFSDTDIKNHLFFQKKQTPQAFGIVFDHTLMGKEGNLGFEVYRLKTFKKGVDKDYVKVVYEVEIPNTLEYFKWIQKFVEDSQKNAPILIKEINEITESLKGDLQEIPGIEDQDLEEEKEDKYPHLTPVIAGVKDGSTKFAEQFLDIFKSQFGMWTNDVEKGAIKSTEVIRISLNQMKEAISNGISKFKKTLIKSLEETIESMSDDIYEYINKRVKAQEQLTSHVSKMKPQLSSEPGALIIDKLKETITKVENSAKSFYNTINNSSQVNSKLKELIQSNSKKIPTIIEETEKINNEIINEVDTSFTYLHELTDNEIEKLNSKITNFKEKYSKMKDRIQKLHLKITGPSDPSGPSNS